MVLRFSRGQRVAHWALAVSFFVLLFSGLTLMIPSLAPLAKGGVARMIHRVFAVVFMLVPVYYALADRKGLQALITESFRYDRDDLLWLLRMPRYFFGRVKGMPPQGRLNAGEKIHHALIILTFITISLTGLVLWFGKGNLSQNEFLGMVMLHDIAMYIMVILTIGHLYFTFVYGALQGMVTGYVNEKYAALEHAKWLASIKAEKTADGKLPQSKSA